MMYVATIWRISPSLRRLTGRAKAGLLPRVTACLIAAIVFGADSMREHHRDTQATTVIQQIQRQTERIIFVLGVPEAVSRRAELPDGSLTTSHDIGQAVLTAAGQAVILAGSTATASAVGLTAEPARGSTHTTPAP